MNFPNIRKIRYFTDASVAQYKNSYAYQQNGIYLQLAIVKMCVMKLKNGKKGCINGKLTKDNRSPHLNSKIFTYTFCMPLFPY